MRATRLLALLLAFLWAPALRAELPLTIEELLTDQGKFKLDLTLVYANSDRRGIFTGDPIVIQTGPTSFISIPTTVGESQGNNDSLAGTLGLRYGLTAKAELYGRASYLHTSQRGSDASGISSSSQGRFADAWMGLNYQFKGDDELPALIGFGEMAVREKFSSSSHSFKSFMLGVTSYKAIDPVVFSLTAAYRFNRSAQDGSMDYKPGNLLLLNPSVSFAANDRVTLTTGLQWTSRQADRRNGQVQGFRRTSTDLLLGTSYGIEKGNALNFTLKANISGRSGADLRFNWLRTF